jgi:prepilin-type N-terminal cleavage/methylation domain-containing protein
VVTKVLAFTLVELLVVIAILSILAAFLFPVFARAKESALKSTDLSNLRQVGMATVMYAGDTDDITPFCVWPNFEATAARILPYAKSKLIFVHPKSKFKIGAWNYRSGCGNDPTCTSGNTMYPPESGCVGSFAVSVLGRVNLFADVYFPLDYEWNDSLTESGRKSVRCQPEAGVPEELIADDGISLTSANFSSVAKAVMWADFPTSGGRWPGGCVDANCDNGGQSDFWGQNFKGYFSEGINAVMVDGHAKWFHYNNLHPCGHEICRAGGDSSAIDWKARGFSWASPLVQ